MKAKRRVIIPNKVWQFLGNLQNFSIFPSFEQAQQFQRDKSPQWRCHMWTTPFGKSFYECVCNAVRCSHVGMDGPASPSPRLIAISGVAVKEADHRYGR